MWFYILLSDKISFEKLNPESLLQIAMLSVGILILFEAIPELINKLFILFKINNLNQNISDDISTLGIKMEIFTATIKCSVALIFIIFRMVLEDYYIRATWYSKFTL